MQPPIDAVLIQIRLLLSRREQLMNDKQREQNRIDKISKDYQDANIKTISLSSAFNPIIRM